MKITPYIASLLPSFGKDRVIEDCRICAAEIKEFTLPAYEAAVPLLGKWKYKSERLDAQFDVFKRLVKGGGQPIVVIEKALKSAMVHLEEIEGRINKTYNEDVAGAGLTYLKANLLQLVELIGFVSKYARRFLLYVYICETAEIEGAGESLADSLSPAEIEWVTANFISFCSAINTVNGKPNEMTTALDNIPDIIVTADNEHSLGETIGESKLDPFQLKLIPTWLNPIYHIGMFVAEWQADRYKVAKEELKLLQLKKLNLEKMSEGKPDAAVQKEIQYMGSRIQTLNYKIEKMEKAYA